MLRQQHLAIVVRTYTTASVWPDNTDILGNWNTNGLDVPFRDLPSIGCFPSYR